ncbi:PH domain-containing protein [Lactococcus garvieae]|uniref:PH domain-containing protein n=1 Tax=Lactococcus TaxID=1357 RepID=UPI0018E13F26|nr:PH domain-containing protein [Lactococcus formosensis]MDG6154899.1 PH domain-containing protein [Lactococcus formosensis]QQC74220.1 PH domain-containing protein [Lactococcus garvieae]
MRTAEEMYNYCVENKFGKGVSKSWAKKHFALIEKNLNKDENVEMCFCGLHNFKSNTKHDSTFAYAITNKRIMMGQKKLIGENFQSVSLKQVNDVTFSSGMIMGVITIDTFKETFNVGVDKVSASNINNIIHEKLFINTQNSASSENTDIKLLKDFKELLDNGIITQEEFNQKKKQLLNL